MNSMGETEMEIDYCGAGVCSPVTPFVVWAIILFIVVYKP